jgi:hypothetical protein
MNWNMNRDQIKQRLQAITTIPTVCMFPGGNPNEWRFKVKETDALQPMLDDIRKEAEMLLIECAPELSYSLFRLYKESGSRQEFERAYFGRRKRLTTFAIMAWLEPENDAYAEALHNIIWSICDEYTWCLPAHISNGSEKNAAFRFSLNGTADDAGVTIDLFAAETAFTLSELMRLVETSLPALLRKRMGEEVFRRVLRPFVHQKSFGWERATHNWASVCAGSIGSAALYLLENTDELAEVLERVLPVMQCYLQGYKEDGACTEGYMYWQYGFGYFVYFADLLKRRTAGQIDLFASEKVHQIALFQQKSFLDGRSVVNFSDSFPEAGVFMGLSHYLKTLYSDVEVPDRKLQASYTDDHCSRWAPAIRNILWFRPDEHGRLWGNDTHYLKDAQWFVSRHITESGRYVFAAKGGHNAEFHNHNDIGHFILHADGKTLLADLGSGLYTRSYFSSQRYEIMCNGAQGHSVPIVNGRYQLEGSESRARIIDATAHNDIEIFSMEFASAYRTEDLQSLVRSFTWKKLDKPLLELEDVFAFSLQPDSIVERLITGVTPMPEGDGAIILSAGDVRLRIVYNAHELDSRIQPFLHTDHFGNQLEFFHIDFNVKQPAENVKVTLTFQFLDVDRNPRNQ